MRICWKAQTDKMLICNFHVIPDFATRFINYFKIFSLQTRLCFNELIYSWKIKLWEAYQIATTTIAHYMSNLIKMDHWSCGSIINWRCFCCWRISVIIVGYLFERSFFPRTADRLRLTNEPAGGGGVYAGWERYFYYSFEIRLTCTSWLLPQCWRRRLRATDQPTNRPSHDVKRARDDTLTFHGSFYTKDYGKITLNLLWAGHVTTNLMETRGIQLSGRWRGSGVYSSTGYNYYTLAIGPSPGRGQLRRVQKMSEMKSRQLHLLDSASRPAAQPWSAGGRAGAVSYSNVASGVD